MLYGGGFFSAADKRSMEQVQAAEPESLADQSFVFEDARLPEMLYRYRARNYPHTLTAEERAQWEEYRFQRLTEPEAGASICMEEFHALIEALQADDSLSAEKKAVLDQLLEYGDSLLS